MSLAEILAMFQSQRAGPVVPMSAGGVPLGSRQPTLQEIVNAAQVANRSQSTGGNVAPPMGGVRW